MVPSLIRVYQVQVHVSQQNVHFMVADFDSSTSPWRWNPVTNTFRAGSRRPPIEGFRKYPDITLKSPSNLKQPVRHSAIHDTLPLLPPMNRDKQCVRPQGTFPTDYGQSTDKKIW